MGRTLSITTTGLAALAVVMLAGHANPQDAAGDWQGRYLYEFDGGSTVGGSPILVDYELTIAPAGSRGGCLLTSRGFQSDEAIVCHAIGDAKKLSITFHGYPDGRLVNRYGVAVYKPGQELFELQREADGDLQTRWGAFRPDDEATAAGVFFRKTS